jgi:hypothetical protein
MTMGNGKVWVALIMSIVAVLEEYFQFSLGLTVEWVEGLIAILTVILVWLAPNDPMSRLR